jgi:hypothetical protein
MNDDARAHDDEIVSAVLDGEATAEERRRVASDPELSARLDAFRRVGNAVAEPVDPLDELAQRRLLDRALEEADSPAVPVTAPRRTHHRWSLGGAAAVASAAVVALLALAGGNALLQARGDDADSVATGPASLEAADTPFYGADDDAYGAADADELSVEAAGADGTLAWIGVHTSDEEFADAARLASSTGVVTPAPTSTTAPAVISGDVAERNSAFAYAPGCPVELIDDAIRLAGPSASLVRGDLAGRPLLGLVSSDDPTAPVVAVDLADCTFRILE